MELIIDGNAFINVAISVTKSLSERDKTIGDKYFVNDLFNDGEFILKDQVRVTFRNFCFNYLNSLIAPLGSSLTGVHIVFDSKSWRKEYIQNFFNDSEFKSTSAPSQFTYKGNRKYDDHQYLFFDYFQKVLVPAFHEKCGVNYYRFKNTEGDDIIAYLCKVLSDKDVVIFSVDHDLKQLVSGDNRNIIFIAPKQMSKHKKLFVPQKLFETKKESVSDDFFSLDDSDFSGVKIDKIIDSLKQKDYVQYEVDAFEEVITKILGGDKSDHIPRIEKMTPVKVTKVISTIVEQYGTSALSLIDSLDETIIMSIVKEIATLNKVTSQDKLDDLREHLIFNIKIIRLSPSVFPEEIQESLREFFSTYEYLPFNVKEFFNLKNNQVLL